MIESEVCGLVALLLAAFPNSKATPTTVQVYESMLLDLDHEHAKRAIARLMVTAKWMPTIAEIRAAAVELSHGARRQGGEAWGDVGMAVRLFGRSQAPTFDDPLVAECVRMLDWVTLCNSTNDVADRARFIELYDQLAIRERTDVVAGQGLTLPKRLTSFGSPIPSRLPSGARETPGGGGSTDPKTLPRGTPAARER